MVYARQLDRPGAVSAKRAASRDVLSLRKLWGKVRQQEMVTGQAATNVGGASTCDHAALHLAGISVARRKRALTPRFMPGITVTPRGISAVYAFIAGVDATTPLAGGHQNHDQTVLAPSFRGSDTITAEKALLRRSTSPGVAYGNELR